MIRIVLYQPDIPQNLGAFMRLCACLGLELHVIEPCGFPLDEKKIRRAAMDYYTHLSLHRHSSWEAFIATLPAEARLLLLTTRASTPYTNFCFRPDDYMLLGSESAGVPDNVHHAATARLIIPMQPGMRSLNVVNSAAMVAGEALRQLAVSSV